jgi:hypothetical protein
MVKKLSGLQIVFLVSFAIAAFLFHSTLKAEQRSVSFKEFDAAQKKLDNIESELRKIEGDKIFGFDKADSIENLISDYLKDISLAYDVAKKEPDKRQQFLETAKSHKEKLERFDRRMNKIEDKVKEASVILDKPLIQSMSTSELEKFKKFLSPEGLNKMEVTYPDIFRTRSKSDLSLITLNIFPVFDFPAPIMYCSSDDSLVNLFGGSIGQCNFDYCFNDCNNKPKWRRPACKLKCTILQIACYVVEAFMDM